MPLNRNWGVAAGAALALGLSGCFSSAPGLSTTSGAEVSGEGLGEFTVSSVGAPPGTVTPRSCVAGDHELFLGADLVDPRTRLVVRLVVDPLDGPALRVYDSTAPFDRSVLFFRDECTTFELDLEPTGWIVNDIVVRSIDLRIECENEEGATIRGRAVAARCN